MHSDKQKLFLTTFKKWVLAKKSGQIPHSAAVWSWNVGCTSYHHIPPSSWSPQPTRSRPVSTWKRNCRCQLPRNKRPTRTGPRLNYDPNGDRLNRDQSLLKVQLIVIFCLGIGWGLVWVGSLGRRGRYLYLNPVRFQGGLVPFLLVR